VQFQTISILPPQKGLEFPGGWGFLEDQKIERNVWSLTRISRGVGRCSKKSLPWGRYGHFLKLHNKIKCSIQSNNRQGPVQTLNFTKLMLLLGSCKVRHLNQFQDTFAFEMNLPFYSTACMAVEHMPNLIHTIRIHSINNYYNLFETFCIKSAIKLEAIRLTINRQT